MPFSLISHLAIPHLFGVIKEFNPSIVWRLSVSPHPYSLSLSLRVSMAKLFFCWHGSCLFSAILGTGSARNKLLKWRPLTRSFSPSLPFSLPSLLSSGLVYVESVHGESVCLMNKKIWNKKENWN